jgi:hypothetical protein
MLGENVAAVLLWLALSGAAVLVILLLLWRYQVAATRARRRRPGRSLFAYLDHR